MAVSPHPIRWDGNPVEITLPYGGGSKDNAIGIVDYYDNSAQILVNFQVASTRHVYELSTNIDKGHWSTAEWSNAKNIDSTGYLGMDIDHPYNGAWYGAAYIEGDTNQLYFVRYQYAREIGNYLTDGSWTMQVDNPIAQLDATVANIEYNMINEHSSLFQIGSRIDVKMALGGSDWMPIGVAYIDSIDVDTLGDSITISGRNTCGYYLNDQTFDQKMVLEGDSVHDIVTYIFNQFGIKDYYIDSSEYPGWSDVKFDIDYKTTPLDILQDMVKTYSTFDPTNYNWVIHETADGKIVVGIDYSLWNYVATDTYRFNVGEEIFARKTSRKVESAYSRICVTGTDADGADLEPVYEDVESMSSWNLLPHKTYYADTVDNITQEQLEAYAVSFAKLLKNNGVTISYTSPIRPQLVIGDRVLADDGLTNEQFEGIITEIKHKFGSSGFKTEFTVESGGYIVTDFETHVITRSTNMNGNNRKKRIMDFL